MMQCREATVFNSMTNNCDWPENVDTSKCKTFLREDDKDKKVVDNLTE